MRRKQHQTTGEGDLFRARLDRIINMKHDLVQLASKIDWERLDGEIAPLYSDQGRPGIATLAVQTPGVFLFAARNAHHAAGLRFTAQMTDQRSNHPIGVDAICLWPSRPPVYLQTDRVEHMVVNAVRHRYARCRRPAGV
jgi:hypothetical protein